MEKKTYIKPQFSLEDNSPISDQVIFFDECIEDYLNNDYNTDKVSQIIKKDQCLDENCELTVYKQYEKKYGFKNRGLISESCFMYNERKNFASKIIRTYKGEENNGLYEEVYYNAILGSLNDCQEYEKIYKSTDKNGTNIEPEYYPNGRIKTCYKYEHKVKNKVNTYINPSWSENGKIRECEKHNILIKEFNNDRQLTTIKNINIEHPKYDINGNMKFCEKIVEEVKRVKKDEQNCDIPYSLEAISTNVKFNENESLDTIEKREINYDSGIKKSEFNIKYTTQDNNHYNTELILFSDKNSSCFTLAYNSHVEVFRNPSINPSINKSFIDTCMFAYFDDKVQTFGLKYTLLVSPDGTYKLLINRTRLPDFPDVPNFPEFESFDKVSVTRWFMPARIYKEDEIEEQKTSENKDGIYIMTELEALTTQLAINIYGGVFKSWPEQKQKRYLKYYNNAKKCINFLDKKFGEVPKFKAISAINSRFSIKDPRRGIVPIPSYAEEVVETNNPQNEVKEAKDFEEVKEIMPNVLEMLKDFSIN